MDPSCDADDDEGTHSGEAPSASTSDEAMGEKSCGAGEQEADIAEADRAQDEVGAPRTAPTGDDLV